MEILAPILAGFLFGILKMLLLMGLAYVAVFLLVRLVAKGSASPRSRKKTQLASHAAGILAVGVVAVVFSVSKLLSLFEAPHPAARAFLPPCKSSRQDVYKAVDGQGDSLYTLIKREYAKHFVWEGTTCRAIYNSQANEWNPLEIDNCGVWLGVSSSLSHADSLNGIDLQGAGNLGGKAFRIQRAGTWSEWRTLPGSMTFTPSIHFRRKFGRFELTPNANFKTLRFVAR